MESGIIDALSQALRLAKDAQATRTVALIELALANEIEQGAGAAADESAAAPANLTARNEAHT